MDIINKILLEWRYQLPAGYPQTDHDYHKLGEVLSEMTDLDAASIQRIVEQARTGNIISESEDIIESIDAESIENQLLLSELQQQNKLQDFNSFLNLLPAEANLAVLAYINQLTSIENIKWFVTNLYSKEVITEQSLNEINYSNTNIEKLFNIEPKGLGKGEILLAFLYQQSKINGGTESYDLSFAGKQYEIKDYSSYSPSKSIRLGTKASITRFKFWDEIITTLNRIDQLRGDIESPKFDFKKLFDKELLDTIQYLDIRRADILSGKLNKQDKKILDLFYVKANQVTISVQGYTNVILRGPNETPIELSIQPIKQTNKDQFTITPIDDSSQDLTYVITELRRLKYVRNPSLLDVDLQNAVDSIVGNDLQFIVFRRDRVRLTNDFAYAVIDNGFIRIIEKALVSEYSEHDDLEIVEG